jgi:ABC-2 type transport system ATP-binding protein
MHNPAVSSASAATAVSVDRLRKAFAGTVALDGVSLTAAAGTITGLLGPNGAGKTTLVRCLTTVLRPDSGSATVAGYDVVTQADAVRASIAVTGQAVALDALLTGRENLVLFGRLLGLAKAAAVARADQLLALFDLSDAGGRKVESYSGGMRRRLDLAVSLVVARPVLFLDEPTTGLDPRGRHALWQTLRELRDDGVAILLTTQYLDEADQLADRIAVIDHGRLIAEGTPAELKQRVGESVCDVRMPDDRSQAAALAELVQAYADASIVDGTIRIPAATAGVVADVIRRLDRAGLVPLDLDLRRPTLDDVFLELTGRVPEQEEGVEA